MIFLAVIVGWLCCLVTVLALARAASKKPAPPVTVVVPRDLSDLLAALPDSDLDEWEALLRTLSEIEALPEVPA